MSHNVMEAREARIVDAWTTEFARLKRRRILPLVLLVAILGLEILRFFLEVVT